MRRILLLVGLCLAVLSAHAQYAMRLTNPQAINGFRIGVEAYHRGRYAEALRLFETVLSTEPGDPLSLYWLGKAYRRLGLDTTALDLWRESMSGDQYSALVEARIELNSLLLRVSQRPIADRYIESRVIENTGQRTPLFLRPSWISSRSDGSILVVANGSNEVLHINPNGLIVDRYSGGVSGFDRPFSLVRQSDGRLVLSEFQPDRLAFLQPNGRIAGYAPQPEGERLVGPQYLAVDADDFIYVSDVGQSRVVKLNPEGGFVTAFSGRGLDFGGLRLPTGLAVLGDRLYVADNALRSLFVFDLYGNLLQQQLAGSLIRPEGISVYQGRLLIADTSRVLLFDPANGELQELYRSPDRQSRLVSASFDRNGDLIVADYNRSRLLVLADPVSVYSGMQVGIERVYPDAFPQVQVDVRVQDAYGQPVVGLTELNFYLAETVLRSAPLSDSSEPVFLQTENLRPVDNFRFVGSLDASEQMDLVFIAEASPYLMERRLELRDSLVAAHAELGSAANLKLIGAQATAQPAVGGSLQAMTAAVLALRPSPDWRFDTALRLAVNELTASSSRRVITLLGSGSINEDQLTDLSLAELASMLRNNRVSLHVVHIGGQAISSALRYLVDYSGGSIHRTDAPRGLVGMADSIRSTAEGLYRLSFTAAADGFFGQRYLPLRLEVYFRDKSGKDESGYYAPLR